MAEAETCPRCGGPLDIQKSRTRTIVTLAEGTLEAREICKSCAGTKSCPTVRSEALRRIVKPRQRYGYDLIVQIGMARYLRGKQREVIREELREKRGIVLSTGSVSYLCDRFLFYLGALHLKRAPELRAAMQGGYPLHLDATCERGKGGLFLCMDGWRDWVLWVGRIPSENADYLRPLVKKTVTLFGLPVATVRDMGEGGARAVEPLRDTGIPDLVCHYHFLAAVGKKLLETLYSKLRGMLRLSAVRTDLRTLLRDLRRYGEPASANERFGPGRVRKNLPALILWILEGTGTKDALFPFSLPHLDFARRCRQALSQADRWVPRPRTQPERRAIRHLGGLIRRLEKDSRIAPTVRALEERWQAFSELRDVLRLSDAELPRGDTRYRQAQLPALELIRFEQIKQAVDEYQADLEERVPPETRQHARPSSPAGIILKYFARYGAHLFGHPARRDEDGNIIAVVERTNNIPEHFFGDDKQRLRRRLGRANLGRDLEQQPAQAALVANLRHASYVRVLCGSLENLPTVFAALNEQELGEAPALVRDHRDKTLQRCIHELLETKDPAAQGEGGSARKRLPRGSQAHRLAELDGLPEVEIRKRCAAVFQHATPTKQQDPRLPPPGTVLTRNYKGANHRVVVLEDGFKYQTRHYAHLSTIAKVIAGTTWSGFRFFGLNRRFRDRPAAVHVSRLASAEDCRAETVPTVV